MSREIDTINTTSDTFGIWIEKTNQVIELVNNNIITTNIGDGDITTGNGFVDGVFGANTLVATYIRAGNVSNEYSLLTLDSNTFVNSSIITIGNSSVNSIHSGYNTIISNSTLSVITSLDGLFVSNTTSNTSILNTGVYVSNSSGSANLLPTSLSIGNSLINVASFSIGTNFIANTTSIKLSNTTANIAISIPSTSQISNGQYFLSANGTWSLVETTVGLSDPAGNNTEIQFNDSGVLAADSGLTFNKTTNILSVTGAVNTNIINLSASQSSSISTTTSGTTQQTLTTFSASSYRSGEFVVSVKHSSVNAYQISKILIIHNDGTSYMTEYGTMYTNTSFGSLGSFATEYSAGVVSLLFTPTPSATAVKIHTNLLAV